MPLSLSDRTDAALITGPPEWFGELFERYSAQLYGYAARRVGPQAAEDLVAEAFLAAFTARSRYDTSAASARPWLFGILTNLLRRSRRSEARAWRAFARAGTDPLARQASQPFVDRAGERIDAQAAVRSIAGVLAAMPSTQRDVLLLHVWAGMDYPELAAALELPPGTVRSRLHRAKARLRDALPDHYAPSV
ncbi:RNA polymerase sigma factor [Cryptosporangium aurantiacum]|uniref:RNA polymerase sigma-70 factor, ECF subfamily n=1 Tax=Cryptosporangium aurantiacum TaxID=134849 RepID=A0A1M7RMV8_9ACTN|nr:sigma-70 family RNA polymerase sigma factor [Cryptosporangium aurantiacum]SHN47665.1 RNA polymerase sigma-70 factor, ECF subfamily [Cryptosporangium aurantiacum]